MAVKLRSENVKDTELYINSRMVGCCIYISNLQTFCCQAPTAITSKHSKAAKSRMSTICMITKSLPYELESIETTIEPLGTGSYILCLLPGIRSQ